jgi:hypothetical protein
VIFVKGKRIRDKPHSAVGEMGTERTREWVDFGR